MASVAHFIQHMHLCKLFSIEQLTSYTNMLTQKAESFHKLLSGLENWHQDNWIEKNIFIIQASISK